jgi:fermentation-respiration switch protein FrsA (DUF1100 family)
MTNFLIAVLVLYIAMVAMLVVFQRSLLYLPDTYIHDPEQYGLSGFTDGFIKTTDGFLIQTWYKPAQNGMPTIVYFHGNASHLGNRAGIYSELAGKGFGVLAVSYRGYGKSEGKSSEQGLYTDARTAILYVHNELKIPLTNVIIFGESLGTGVAVQMASEYKIAGLVLQAPYTSIANRAAEIYWFIPVRLVLLDKFDSLSKIRQVQAPLLIFHGELDATIPIEHGKKLFAAANSPKEAVFFSEIEHNNFDSSKIASKVLEFADKLIKEK